MKRKSLYWKILPKSTNFFCCYFHLKDRVEDIDIPPKGNLYTDSQNCSYVGRHETITIHIK